MKFGLPVEDVVDSDRKRRERKRKGKAIVTPIKKNSRQPSMVVVIQERDPEEVRQREEALRFERRSK